MNNNPCLQYQKNSILSSSQSDLTLSLYNGALKFCNQTMDAIKNKEYEKAHEYNMRVQDIIDELLITLDYKYPIAEEMASLYYYIKDLLVEANISKNIEPLNTAISLIRDFRDVWFQAVKQKTSNL